MVLKKFWTLFIDNEFSFVIIRKELLFILIKEGTFCLFSYVLIHSYECMKLTWNSNDFLSCSSTSRDVGRFLLSSCKHW